MNNYNEEYNRILQLLDGDFFLEKSEFPISDDEISALEQEIHHSFPSPNKI